MSCLHLVLVVAFVFISWFYYTEDRYVLKIHGMPVSPDSVIARNGMILRLGCIADGSVASHWLGRPLHHYVLVLSIDHKLCVVHTWYKKLTKHGNIYIPPSYIIQPLDQFIQYTKFKVVEVFYSGRYDHLNYTMDEIVSYLRSFGNSVRCYVTIINLMIKLGYEVQVGRTGSLLNYWIWSFFIYKPLWFEQALLSSHYEKTNVMLLSNLLNEPSTLRTNNVLHRTRTQ